MKILNPPVKLCSQILEFLYEFHSRKKYCSPLILQKNFPVSSNYYSLALTFLSQHKLLIKPTPDVIGLSDNAKKELEKSSNNSVRLIYEQLMGIQPFIEFTYFLGKGKTEKESIKLVTSLYNILQNESGVLKIFQKWIKLLGIKTSEKPLKNKTLDGIKDSLQNKLYANNFIKEFLGDGLRNVSEQVITELSNAIKEIPEDNEASVNEVGRALEDFLRLDLAKDIDLSHCSGIGEIANELNKHPQYPKKLNSLCLGLSSIRSIGKAHGADKILKVKWSITEHGATGYIIIVLSVIKSYLAFKQENKIIF